MNENYGFKLKYYRKSAGLTQAEAAKRLGISRSTLSRYENKSPKLPLSLFIEMSALYRFDVFDVLGVHDIGKILILDMSLYHLIKEHARYMITNEYGEHRGFCNTLNKEHYNKKYKEYIGNTVETVLSYESSEETRRDIITAAADDTDFQCIED